MQSFKLAQTVANGTPHTVIRGYDDDDDDVLLV
jgi:hypothetical protein